MNQNRKSPAALEPNILFSTLRAMMNKEYIFKSDRLRVEDVVESGDKYIIVTNAKNMTLNVDQANVFVAETFPIENIQPQSTPPQSLQPATRQEGMIDDMTEALYESFQNIRARPTKETIEQATALSNTANTISNMMKLKLQAQKVIGKSKI
jgi:hypothetical protein